MHEACLAGAGWAVAFPMHTVVGNVVQIDSGIPAMFSCKPWVLLARVFSGRERTWGSLALED